MLNISNNNFTELYPQIANYYDWFNSKPKTVKEFEQVYIKSKLWRLNNLYTIINKYGEPVIFKMNWAQHVAYAASKKHPRLCILKSRQQGISTLWLVSFFDDAIFCPFLNIGLMAQGKDEATKLLERTKFLWDKLSPDVKNFLGIGLDKDNAGEVSFTNNSTIFIRVSFRSTTLQRLHISEFGKIANMYPDRAKEVFTGTLQALAKGNTGIIESTAEGNNRFKDVYYNGVLAKESNMLSTKDFYPVFLPWTSDPDCVLSVNQIETTETKKYLDDLEPIVGKLNREQRNFYVAQSRELGDEVHQEYPATAEEAFKATKDGTYYSKLFTKHIINNKRILKDLAVEGAKTDVYFDLGVDDYAVLLFVQRIRGKTYIVDELYNDGYGLEYYLDEIKNSDYEIGTLRLPHDIKVRETTYTNNKGRAKSRYALVQEWLTKEKLDWRTTVLKKYNVIDGIDQVRKLIKNELYLDAKCEYIVKCFLNYSKEWDAKLEQWKTTPYKDVYNHGADTVRYLATDNINTANNKYSGSNNSMYNSGGVAV